MDNDKSDPAFKKQGQNAPPAFKKHEVPGITEVPVELLKEALQEHLLPLIETWLKVGIPMGHVAGMLSGVLCGILKESGRTQQEMMEYMVTVWKQG